MEEKREEGRKGEKNGEVRRREKREKSGGAACRAPVVY